MHASIHHADLVIEPEKPPLSHKLSLPLSHTHTLSHSHEIPIDYLRPKPTGAGVWAGFCVAAAVVIIEGRGGCMTVSFRSCMERTDEDEEMAEEEEEEAEGWVWWRRLLPEIPPPPPPPPPPPLPMGREEEDGGGGGGGPERKSGKA
jgi:hypothetical protein